MEKNKYIVLFFTQYGAMSYAKLLSKHGIEGVAKPVPRTLSSSCGICVEAELTEDVSKYKTHDVEAIYQVMGPNQYHLVFES